MNNIKKLSMIIIVVIIGFIIAITNLKSDDKAYVVSDVENKNNNYKEDKTDEKSDLEYTETQINMDSKPLDKKITIYVSGEVKKPGVVELNGNDRLMDGVNLCGGLTVGADLNAINLAMKIEDEGHYIIPKIGEKTEVKDSQEIDKIKETDKSININSDEVESVKVNLNTATIMELDSLPGFGEVTAQKIIDYREENLKFNSIEEIKNIKGIGEKKFNNVKEYICVQ